MGLEKLSEKSCSVVARWRCFQRDLRDSHALFFLAKALERRPEKAFAPAVYKSKARTQNRYRNFPKSSSKNLIHHLQRLRPCYLAGNYVFESPLNLSWVEPGRPGHVTAQLSLHCFVSAFSRWDLRYFRAGLKRCFLRAWPLYALFSLNYVIPRSAVSIWLEKTWGRLHKSPRKAQCLW